MWNKLYVQHSAACSVSWLVGEWKYTVWTAVLRNMYVCELLHALSKQPSDRSRDPAPPTPPITSTGFFLPVGWFLPLCSLHFLHTHISLQQPYLFLNLAQVLWRIWKSDNSLFSSLSSFSSLSLWQFLYRFFGILSIERFISHHFPQITTCWIVNFSVLFSKHICTKSPLLHVSAFQHS